MLGGNCDKGIIDRWAATAKQFHEGFHLKKKAVVVQQNVTPPTFIETVNRSFTIRQLTGWGGGKLASQKGLRLHEVSEIRLVSF